LEKKKLEKFFCGNRNFFELFTVPIYFIKS
jgi:hypothetical protein